MILKKREKFNFHKKKQLFITLLLKNSLLHAFINFINKTLIDHNFQHFNWPHNFKTFNRLHLYIFWLTSPSPLTLIDLTITTPFGQPDQYSTLWLISPLQNTFKTHWSITTFQHTLSKPNISTHFDQLHHFNIFCLTLWYHYHHHT